MAVCVVEVYDSLVVVELVVKLVVSGIVVVIIASDKIVDEMTVDWSRHGSCSVFTQRHADSSNT